MTTHALARLAARLALVWAVLTAATLAYGDRVAAALVPLYGGVFLALAPEVQIQRLQVRDTGARSELYLEVRTRDVVPALAGGHPRVPAVLPAVLGVGTIAQSLVITLGVVLAWPATGLGQRLWLLFLGACAALLAQVLTVPFFLLGEVESLARVFTAGAHAERPLVRFWFLVLDNGGVWAVSLAAGVAAVVMARGTAPAAVGASPTRRAPPAAAPGPQAPPLPPPGPPPAEERTEHPRDRTPPHPPDRSG